MNDLHNPAITKQTCTVWK